MSIKEKEKHQSDMSEEDKKIIDRWNKAISMIEFQYPKFIESESGKSKTISVKELNEAFERMKKEHSK